MISREFPRYPICRRAIAGGLDSLRRAWVLRTMALVLLSLAATALTLRAQSVTTFATGFSAPNGLAFDSAGNLYVANELSGTVSKVTPGGGVTPDFATGFSRPKGLAFNPVDHNLYVADYGYGVGTVSKVTLGGGVSAFASGLVNLTALVFDTAGNLYVSEDKQSKV